MQFGLMLRGSVVGPSIPLVINGVFCGRIWNRLRPRPSDLSRPGAILGKWRKQRQTQAALSGAQYQQEKKQPLQIPPTLWGQNNSLSQAPAPHINNYASNGPHGPFLMCTIKKKIISKVEWAKEASLNPKNEHRDDDAAPGIWELALNSGERVWVKSQLCHFIAYDLEQITQPWASFISPIKLVVVKINIGDWGHL